MLYQRLVVNWESPNVGTFVTQPRYSTRMSKLGLISYANPAPYRPPTCVCCFTSRFVVPELTMGRKINPGGPASTNGLKFLKTKVRTYAPDISSVRVKTL